MGNLLNVFISYSTKLPDRKIACLIKKYFINYCGFNCFLAHEDIKPSKEWEEGIINNLKQADVFLVLISKHSNRSSFVQQEVGFALALNKIIIPLKIDKLNPEAFLSKIQVLAIKKFDYYNLLFIVFQTTLLLIEINGSNKLLIDKIINSLVQILSQSDSLNKTRAILKPILKILEIKSLSKEKKELLRQIIESNKISLAQY